MIILFFLIKAKRWTNDFLRSLPAKFYNSLLINLKIEGLSIYFSFLIFFTMQMKVKKKVVEQTFWYNYDTLRKRETDSYFPKEQVFKLSN